MSRQLLYEEGVRRVELCLEPNVPCVRRHTAGYQRLVMMPGPMSREQGVHAVMQRRKKTGKERDQSVCAKNEDSTVWVAGTLTSSSSSSSSSSSAPNRVSYAILMHCLVSLSSPLLSLLSLLFRFLSLPLAGRVCSCSYATSSYCCSAAWSTATSIGSSVPAAVWCA